MAAIAHAAPETNHRGSHDDNHEPPSWTRWFTIISVLFAVAALVATIWWAGPRTLWKQLVAIGWGFAAIIAIEGAVTACDSAALRACLGKAGDRLTYWQVLKAQIGGRAINTVTPLASLGEATKVTMLMQRISSRSAVAGVIRYNLLLQAIKFTLMAVSAPICALLLDLPRWLEITFYVGGAIAACVLALGAIVVHRGMIGTAVEFLRHIRVISRQRADTWRGKVKEIDAAIAQRDQPDSKTKRWSSTTPLLWMVVSRALTITSTWTTLAFSGYVASVGALAALATAGPILNLPAALVPMGLGVLEGGNAALLVALGASASLGVTATLAGRVTSLFYATVGLVMLTASDIAPSVVRAGKPKRA